MLDLVFSLYTYSPVKDNVAGALVWTFPPQSVAERALDAGENHVLATLTGDVTLDPALQGRPFVEAFLSGPSRLAFGLGEAVISRLSQFFTEPQNPAGEALDFTDIFKVCLDDPGVKILAPRVVNNRTSDSNDALPQPWLTSIEFPAGLFLASYENARWRSTARNPKDSSNRPATDPAPYYELWHLDLPEATPQTGSAGLIDPRLNPNKPPGRLFAFYNVNTDPSLIADSANKLRPFPLGDRERQLLAGQMTRGWGDIESQQFQLSSIGASCSLRYLCDRQPATAPSTQDKLPGAPPPPPILSKWEHRAQLGRDNYCRVSIAGFLLPFLFPASYTQITTRVMADDGTAAVLVKRYYIEIKNPVQNFYGHESDPGFDHLSQLGRGIPFKQVVSQMPAIIEIANPEVGCCDLDDPDQYIFFPYHFDTNNQPRPLPFLFSSIDCAGNKHQLSGPVLFCSNLALGTKFYNQRLTLESSTPGSIDRLTNISVSGPPLCIAPPAQPFEIVPETIGATDKETVLLGLTGNAPAYTFAPQQPGAPTPTVGQAWAPMDLARAATTILSGVEVRINDTFGEISRTFQQFFKDGDLQSKLQNAAQSLGVTFSDIQSYVGCFGGYHLDLGNVPGLVTQISNRVIAQVNLAQLPHEKLFAYVHKIVDTLHTANLVDIEDSIEHLSPNLAQAQSSYDQLCQKVATAAADIATCRKTTQAYIDTVNEYLKQALVIAQQKSNQWNQICATLESDLPLKLSSIATDNEWRSFAPALLIEIVRADFLTTLKSGKSLAESFASISAALENVSADAHLQAPIDHAKVIFTQNVSTSVAATVTNYFTNIDGLADALQLNAGDVEATLVTRYKLIQSWVRTAASAYNTLNLRFNALEKSIKDAQATFAQRTALWKDFVAQLQVTCQRIAIENKDAASIFMQLAAIEFPSAEATLQGVVSRLTSAVGNIETNAHQWATEQVDKARQFVSKFQSIDETVKGKLQQWCRHVLPSEASDICSTIESLSQSGQLGQDLLNQLRDQFVSLTRSAFVIQDQQVQLAGYLHDVLNRLQAKLNGGFENVQQAIKKYSGFIFDLSNPKQPRVVSKSVAELNEQWEAVTSSLQKLTNPADVALFCQQALGSFVPDFSDAPQAVDNFVNHLTTTLAQDYAGSLENARSFLAHFRDPAATVEPVIRSALSSFSADVVRFDNAVGSKLGELQNVLDDQLSAYPKLVAATVNIPSINPTDYLPVEFHDAYLRMGISELTSAPGGLIAQFQQLTQTATDAAQQLGSSFVNPTLQFPGLGRKLGALAGEASLDDPKAYLNQWKDAVTVELQKSADAAAKSILPDVTQMVPNATLLGGIKLSDLLALVTNGSDSWKKLPQVALHQLPDRIERRWDWHGVMKPFNGEIVAFNFKGPRVFTIHSRATALRNGVGARLETELHAEIERLDSTDDIEPPLAPDAGDDSDNTGDDESDNSLFNLIIGSVLQINFTKCSFTKNVDNSTRLDLDLDLVRPVQLIGQLDFIEEARQELTALLEDIGIEIKLEDNALSAGWCIDVPAISSGAMVIEGLSFASVVRIPLSPSALQYEFSLASQEQPFIVTVSGFGGGGYVLVRIGSDGYKLVQGDIRFGAEIAISVAVAAGKLWLMGGIFFAFSSNGSQVTAFVDAGGSVLVFGFVTITVEIRLGLSYQTSSENTLLFGQCQVYVSIKVGFFSKSASFSFSKEFIGSKKSSKGRTGDLYRRSSVLLASVGDAGLESAFERLAESEMAGTAHAPPPQPANPPDSTFRRRFRTNEQWNRYWKSFRHIAPDLN